MMPWPRTLLGRVLVLQLAFLITALAALMLLVTRHQVEANAEQLAQLWSPALAEMRHRDKAVGAWTIAVRRDIAMRAGPPPAEAWNPEGTPRFTAIAEALRRSGLPVRGLRVSGPTRDAVLWVELEDAEGSRWIGIETALEGEDLPWRFLAALVAALLAALGTSAVIAWMVAAPARRLADAVKRFGEGDPEPPLPTGGPAEIRALVGTVRDTFVARRDLDAQRELMLAGLSHDLRAPLSRIRLTAELADAPGWAVARERIIANADALDRMIEDFATLVRDEAGPLDVREDIAALVSAAARDAAWPGSCTVDGAGVVVAGRGSLLRRLVDNLLENALRYGRAPFELEVARTPSDECRVRICNAVDGALALDPERLRQPFQRGEPHRNTPGTGLGLSIVDRIATRLGGRLVLELRDGGRQWVASVHLPLVDGAGRADAS